MKILLAGTYPDGTADKFRAMLPGHEIAAAETQEQYDAVEDCEIIVVRVLKTPEKTLDNKKQLKAVIRWGASSRTRPASTRTRLRSSRWAL